MKIENIFLILILFSIKLSEQKPKIFSDILTEDNELILIEPKAQSHTNKKPVKNNTKTNQTPTNEKSLSSSKLIVNIVYQNSNQTELSSSKLNTVNKIVYSTSDNSDPCLSSPCKKNQLCIPRLNSTKNYECVQKPKKVSSSTKMRTRKPIKYNCNLNDLIILKLNFFELFDKLIVNNSEYKQDTQDKINFIEFSCLEPVSRMFNQIDSNQDRLLDKQEWSKYQELYLNENKCYKDLYLNCDLDQDNYITYEELCKCFQGVKQKCAFMRDPANLNIKKDYLAKLNQAFKNNKTSFNLTDKSYVSICDLEGYFVQTQCDNKVTCWCVEKNGDPVENSLRSINQTPIDCSIY